MIKTSFLVFALLLTAGCSTKQEYKTTSSGIKYVDNNTGTGVEVKKGDLVKVNYSAWIVKNNKNLFGDWDKDSTKQGDLFFSTDYIHQPVKFVVGTGMLIKGSDDGFLGMKVGGIRTMVIPSKLAYGKEGTDHIPSNTDIRLKVELLDAKKSTESIEWPFDTTKIMSTKDGLKYVIIQQGSGPNPVVGQKVVVNYSGFLSNGKKFDSSFDREEAIMFELGKNQVIPGLEEGIKLINKGTKAVFIIPPSLGYGDRDMGQIPPYSTLTFDIELLDIR